MEDNKQKRYEKPKMPRSPLFWVLVALLGLLLISTTLSTSSYLRGSTEKVEYSAFLQMVAQGQVDQVSIGTDIITFTLKTENKLTWFYNTTGIKRYQTVPVNDPNLVDRLTAAGVTFGGESQTGVSFLGVLISIILPLAFYALIIFFQKGRLGHGRDELWQEQRQDVHRQRRKQKVYRRGWPG